MGEEAKINEEEEMVDVGEVAGIDRTPPAELPPDDAGDRVTIGGNEVEVHPMLMRELRKMGPLLGDLIRELYTAKARKQSLDADVIIDVVTAENSAALKLIAMLLGMTSEELEEVPVMHQATFLIVWLDVNGVEDLAANFSRLAKLADQAAVVFRASA